MSQIEKRPDVLHALAMSERDQFVLVRTYGDEKRDVRRLKFANAADELRALGEEKVFAMFGSHKDFHTHEGSKRVVIEIKVASRSVPTVGDEVTIDIATSMKDSLA